MLKRWLSTGGVLAAAAALLLLLPQTSSAQFRQRGFGVNAGPVGFYYGSGSPYYYGAYPGYSGWNRPYYGSTWYPSNYGWSSAWQSQNWSGPSYTSDWSSPSYSGYSYPSRTAGSYYSSDMNTGSYYGTPQGEMPRAPERNVVFDVRVPPNAEIWFEGAKTQQTGMFREFLSPPLERGQDFTYHVRARWNENGKEVDKTRELRVRAGDHMMIDFLGESATGSAFPSEQPRGGGVPSRTGQNPERMPTYGADRNLDRTGTETDRNLNRPGTGTERTPEQPGTTPSTPRGGNTGKTPGSTPDDR